LPHVVDRNTVLRVTTLSFKVSDDLASRIRGQARQEKLTLSEYLRRRAGGAATEPVKPGRVRCAFTGAMIFAPLSGQPPLTTEAVKEFMAEFP
jgi:hypothetical protein